MLLTALIMSSLMVALEEQSPDIARPDTKTQVTAEYIFDNGACVPIRVHTVVVSCQHSEKVTLEALRKDIMEKVVYTEGRVDRSAAYAKIRRRAKRNRAEREPLK